MTDEATTQPEQLAIGRRPFVGFGLATIAGMLASARPADAQSAARKSTLVIGLDISDAISLDPARIAQYTNPMIGHAAYETLVTMTPGDYVTIRPLLATSWGYTPDGKSIRFKLREGVKFSTGKVMTAEDVRFSLMRVINVKDQPSQYIAHVDRVEIVDPSTVDMVLKDPTQPVLTIITAPEFIVMEKAVAVANGASDAADAKEKDTAVNWLNENSCGSGPYRLTGWQRNQQVQMVANPNYWGGKPGYERVLIRHMSESAAQLLALKRGDIDVAFNLIPEQVATLKDDPNITVMGATSLDFIYLALAESPDNPALQKKAARQAIGYAIDYDGIIASLIGGEAVRPASFIPVGMNGSTEALTKEIGFRQDLDRAKKLLAEAGLPNGFSFQLAYGNAAIAGVSYQNLAQKIQSDLARVGIKAELAPMDQLNMRTMYLGGKGQGILTFWNPPGPENQLWAAATINRVAKRVHWDVPADIRKLVDDAAAERDLAKSAVLWRKYQEVMVDVAHHFVMIQPKYQVAVRKSVAGLKLTAAGWMVELAEAKPA